MALTCGRYSTYRAGCRCPLCSEAGAQANARHQAAYREKIIARLTQMPSWTEAEPMRPTGILCVRGHRVRFDVDMNGATVEVCQCGSRAVPRKVGVLA
jgi:hypothetical protein